MFRYVSMCMLICFSTITLANSESKLPVSELHVHAEAGVMTDANIKYLANKHHLNLSRLHYVREGVIYHRPGDFMDFLKIYDQVTSLIQDADDVTYVIYDYLKRAHEEGAIYEELTVSPMHFPQLGYRQFINAAALAIDRAHHDFDIDARLLVVVLRHKGPAAGERMLDTILAHPHPYVVGISLAGDDLHYPAGLFGHLYQRAKKAGLKLTAHMGEHTSANDIRTAIKMKLDRIGHGVSVASDEKLMHDVAQSGVGFEVCPSSNIDGGNGIYKSFQEHPFNIMRQHGLKVSINTDDPGFLHTSIGREYRMVQQAYHLSPKDMVALCRDAVRMSFAPTGLKRKLLKKIDVYAVKMSGKQV